jgi:hydrogenase maturation protease
MRETQQMGVFQQPDRILLMGLGNILLGDEGVGIHAVLDLKDRYRFDPPIEIVDGGTLGLDLLPFFENSDNVLFVDAIDFGKEPGYVGEIEDGNIPSALQTKLSVHHIGISDLLLAALWMDKKPKKICLIGMQPESLAMGLELSEPVKSKMEEIVERVIMKLETWGVVCTSPSP